MLAVVVAVDGGERRRPLERSASAKLKRGAGAVPRRRSAWPAPSVDRSRSRIGPPGTIRLAARERNRDRPPCDLPPSVGRTASESSPRQRPRRREPRAVERQAQPGALLDLPRGIARICHHADGRKQLSTGHPRPGSIDIPAGLFNRHRGDSGRRSRGESGRFGRSR